MSYWSTSARFMLGIGTLFMMKEVISYIPVIFQPCALRRVRQNSIEADILGIMMILVVAFETVAVFWFAVTLRAPRSQHYVHPVTWSICWVAACAGVQPAVCFNVFRRNGPRIFDWIYTRHPLLIGYSNNISFEKYWFDNQTKPKRSRCSQSRKF